MLPQARHVLDHLCRLTDPGDGPLLDRFLHHRDEAAFAALLERHGPLVLGVCRRILGDAHDADDAFQATFLVLLRKAASIRRRESLGHWLYEVAYRTAVRAKRNAARRREQERKVTPVTHADPAAEVAWRELKPILDEELRRLPEAYRRPLVLCYLAGVSVSEAARRLGWPRGTVAGRLARARELLRTRLARRGLTLAGSALAALLTERASAQVPAALAAATRRAALLTAAGTIPAPLAALTDGVVRSLGAARLKGVTALVLMLGLVAAGAGVVARRAVTAEPYTEASTATPQAGPAKADAEKPARLDLFGDPLPDGALLRLGTTRLRHGGTVYGMAFAPDGKVLASGGEDEVVRLWDPATGKQLRMLEGHGGAVRAVAFAPDGKALATGSDGNPSLVRLWDLATGKELLRVEAGRDRTYAVAFAPDGKSLAAAGDDGVVRVWEVAAGQLLHQLSGHRQSVNSLSIAPKGDVLASGGEDGAIRLWDLAAGKELHTLRPGEKSSRFYSVAFSPDGKTLAAGGAYYERVDERSGRSVGVLSLWDPAAGKWLRNLKTEDKEHLVAGVLFSPDGKTLAAAHHDETLRLWDVAAGKPLRQLRGFRNLFLPLPYGLAFSPDGKVLAAAGNDHAVCLWDTGTGKPLHLEGQGHEADLRAVAIAPDGKTLATGGPDQGIVLWDARTAKPVRTLKGHDGWVYALAFAPDGKTLASGGSDGTARLWDAASGKELHALRVNKHLQVFRLTFSPDGKVLAAAHENPLPERIKAAGEEPGKNCVCLWDTASGKALHTCESAERHTASLAFSPDGKALISTGESGTMRTWQVATGKELSQSSLRGAKPRVQEVVFSPDGKTVASSGLFEDAVLLWEAGADRPWARLHVPDSFGHHLAFAPDGRFLATASVVIRRPKGERDRSVRVYEIASGKEVLRFTLPPGSDASSVTFTPDGRSLVTGMTDATALVWDLVPPAPDKTDVRQLWADLASADASKAYRAIHALARSKEIVALVQKELAPAAAADPKHVQQLLADLEGEDFAVREKATAELEKLAELAEAALRQKLDDKPPLETRRRVEDLLDKLKGPATLPEHLRSRRAVTVLEQLGTAEARKLLQGLAKGAPAARLTREAGAALERLQGQ